MSSIISSREKCCSASPCSPWEPPTSWKHGVDPGSQSDRRVGEGVPDRLRPGRHLLQVGRQVLVVVATLHHHGAFLVSGFAQLVVGWHERRHVQVNAGQPDALGAFQGSEFRGDGSAEVATLGKPSRVAQALHQHRPGARGTGQVPAGAGGMAGESEAGQAGDHDVERVRRRAAVCRRVGQRPDGVTEFQHRTRPAVGRQQGSGAGHRGADMDEVDVQTVDVGCVLAPSRSAAIPLRASRTGWPSGRRADESGGVEGLGWCPRPSLRPATECAAGGTADRRVPTAECRS